MKISNRWRKALLDSLFSRRKERKSLLNIISSRLSFGWGLNLSSKLSHSFSPSPSLMISAVIKVVFNFVDSAFLVALNRSILCCFVRDLLNVGKPLLSKVINDQ